MKIPNWLIRLLPYFDYICPKCKKEVKKNSHKCPYCREQYSKPLRVPPKLLKNPKALEEYVHKHVFPRASKSHREYLTQFFTEFLNSGWEDSGGTDITDNGKWKGGTGTVVASPTHHGSYVAQHAAPAWGWVGEWVNFTAQTTLFVRFHLRWASVPSGLGRLLRLQDQTPYTVSIELYTNNTTLRLRDVVNNQNYDCSYSFQADKWYCVEVKAVVNTASNGELRAWIDGSEVITQTGLDLSGTVEIDRLNIGQYGQGEAITNYIDCVVVADMYIGPEEEGATYTETWQTDALFEKLGIQKSLNVGAAFQKSFMTHKQVDGFFQKLDVLESCGLDVYFGDVVAETYAKSCGLDVVFAYKVSFPELWFDEEGRIVLNLSKPYMWVGS